MAQTRRKRKRKHRGTQAGTIERPGRTGRSQTRTDARRIAQQRRAERFDKPPTWRGALNKAAIAAALFGVIIVLAFGRSPAQGAVLAAFTLLMYVPMSYYTDLLFHRRRQRQKERAGAASSGGRGGGHAGAPGRGRGRDGR
jgi:hypothetical protein